jgi:hypothetical protein
MNSCIWKITTANDFVIKLDLFLIRPAVMATIGSHYSPNTLEDSLASLFICIILREQLHLLENEFWSLVKGILPVM